MIESFTGLKPHHFETCWTSPANIAFVKYWGKKGHQLPANPSVSLTLKECVTTSRVSFTPASQLSVELVFEGTKNPLFGLKIESYLQSLAVLLPWIRQLNVKIETSNTFPHGAGIASSASGLSALALALTDYLHFLNPPKDPATFLRHASFLARLASGSACRSIYGGFATWGESHLEGSSDDYASSLTVHPELTQLLDSVVVVSSQEKKVSSREGHSRLKEHFFAEARFAQARNNFRLAIDGLKSGDMTIVGEVLESEALSLHAMMMTSPQSYTLLRPNSLLVMEMVRSFRTETKLPLYFTLDAGPNVHLIYPDTFRNKIETFISNELAPFAQRIIADGRGEGPVKC
jgi:diphosphomevalonate decarboxylase